MWTRGSMGKRAALCSPLLAAMSSPLGGGGCHALGAMSPPLVASFPPLHAQACAALRRAMPRGAFSLQDLQSAANVWCLRDARISNHLRREGEREGEREEEGVTLWARGKGESSTTDDAEFVLHDRIQGALCDDCDLNAGNCDLNDGNDDMMPSSGAATPGAAASGAATPKQEGPHASAYVSIRHTSANAAASGAATSKHASASSAPCTACHSPIKPVNAATAPDAKPPPLYGI
jgi:hypothetical protein